MPRSPTVYIQCHRDRTHLKAFNKYVPRSPVTPPSPTRRAQPVGGAPGLTYGKASAWVRQHCHIVRTCLHLVRRYPNLIRDDSLQSLWEFLLPFLRLCALTTDPADRRSQLGRRGSRSDSDLSSVHSASSCSLPGFTDLRSETTAGSPMRDHSTLPEPERKRTMKAGREDSGRYLVPPTPEYPRSRSPRESSTEKMKRRDTSKERSATAEGRRRESRCQVTCSASPCTPLSVPAISPSLLPRRYGAARGSSAQRREETEKHSHRTNHSNVSPASVVGPIKLPPIMAAPAVVKSCPTSQDDGGEGKKDMKLAEDEEEEDEEEEEEEEGAKISTENRERDVIMVLGENVDAQRKTTYLVYRGPHRGPEIVRWPPNREERRESLLTLLAESDSDFSIPLDVVIDLEFDSRSSTPDSFL